jgi:bifunctional DNA-binding transcriptional regulator/antitoxin component of YhaV-PrlF toxin-antitoxin module
MRNTRDHAEIPEIREVLGLEPLDGVDAPEGADKKRWTKALLERKGTGLTIIGRSGSSLSKKLAELENEGQSSDACTRPMRVMR